MKLHERIHLVGSGEIGLSDTWDCHVYALETRAGIVLIDAGGGRPAGVAAIEANLRADGLDPARITDVLLTHWHKDHGGGAKVWRAKYGAKVWLNAIEQPLMAGSEWACPIDGTPGHGDDLTFGDMTLKVIQVTSHSEGICAYLLELDGYRALFSADIVFANGLIGLINYPGSSMDGYRANLSRLAGLKVEGLFPGHLLFSVRRGQRHIDIALERIKGGFIPPSIGQSDITMTIPEDY